MKAALVASVILLGSAMSFSPRVAQAADYHIDTEGAHAFIQFRVNHLGFSWLYGRFNQFTGSFHYDAADLSTAHIGLTIDTSSIDSNHQERDQHLRSADFLNVAAHPEAHFRSTQIKATDDGRLAVHGELTLNGITRALVIDAEKMGEGTDPWGGHRAGFSGTTKFALRDFGINYDLGPAATHVYLDLTVEGIRQ
ncbi:YceI family protein [Alkalimonas delamerensis]|uniref:YceI family protein n=1 Tax=Alkalimonas delamerensis TaxID=265981 RepID=A0ABT9GP49_9GAMM|nr:YceI family protein [Alkalimonas delamerensis]MDP4528684.1 YceI family protein [Alkalimonas delamerensis]